MNQKPTQNLLQKGILSLCLFQLAFGPGLAIAQQAGSSKPTSQAFLEGAIELTKMGVGLYNQNLMQQAMIAQMANGSRNFTPNLEANSLVAQCNMPRRPDPMPVKCDPPVGEVNPAQAAASMASVCNAEKAMNFLKGALPDGEAASTVSCPNPMNGMQTPTPTGILPGANYGLRCMDNFRENLALQIQTGVLNDLKRIKSQLAQELGRAREVNNKIMRDMEDVSNELNGNQNPDSGVDLAKYFDGDAACQLAMDKGLMSKINGAGLRGVEKMFLEPRGEKQIPISSAAKDYITNRDAIKKDLRNTITKMSEFISKRGADGLLNSLDNNKGADLKLDINATQFASLQGQMGQSIAAYKAEKERVTSKLTELGFKAPNLTEDFELNSNELLNSSTFMDSCFNGGNAGTSMSLDSLRFKTKDGFGGGTIEGRVKKRLDEILSNPDMGIETKLSEIRSLDQTIMRQGNEPILQISVDIDGAPKNISVSDFYQFQQKNCESKFNASDESKNFKEAKDLLNNLKDVGKSFQSEFSELAKKIENCNGASLRNNPNACADGSAMDPSSPAFCMDTADRCANSVNSCMNKAKNIVKQKEAQRKDLANMFNANMQNLQSIYDAQIVGLNQVVSGFQKSLGGLAKVAEVVPEIDRIGILKMQKSPFGIDLFDGGSFDRFEKEVPQAIDAMMAAVEQQGQAINDKINEEAQNKELPRLQSLIAEFEEIKQTCQAVYQKMQQDIAERQKEQAEQFKKASEVCSKARNLFAPSVKPGCETLKSLAGDMHEIANVLTPNAMGFANGLSNYCDREDSADNPEGDDEIGALARACSRGGEDGAKKELESLKQKLLGNSTYDERVKSDPTFADSPQGRAGELVEAALKELEKMEKPLEQQLAQSSKKTEKDEKNNTPPKESEDKDTNASAEPEPETEPNQELFTTASTNYGKAKSAIEACINENAEMLKGAIRARKYVVSNGEYKFKYEEGAPDNVLAVQYAQERAQFVQILGGIKNSNPSCNPSDDFNTKIEQASTQKSQKFNFTSFQQMTDNFQGATVSGRTSENHICTGNDSHRNKTKQGTEREKRAACVTAITELLIEENANCLKQQNTPEFPKIDATRDQGTLPPLTEKSSKFNATFCPKNAEKVSSTTQAYESSRTEFEKDHQTLASREDTASTIAPKAAETEAPKLDKRNKNEAKEITVGGTICEQLERDAKIEAYGSRNGDAASAAKNKSGACFSEKPITKDKDGNPTGGGVSEIEGCSPDEKFSEYMNNPKGHKFKLIEQAIKKGRQVSGDGSSSPFLNSLGENLAGQCHMGETPNPGDVTNPFAPQQQTQPFIQNAIQL